MDIKKITDSINTIEIETPVSPKEVRLNFIYDDDDFLILQATQDGLIRFASEILKFAISSDNETLNNPKYNFSSMSNKESEFHLIEIEKVEDIQNVERYPQNKKKQFFTKVAFGLIGAFVIIVFIVGLIASINYLNK